MPDGAQQGLDQASGLRRLCGGVPRRVVTAIAAQRGSGRTRLLLGAACALAELGRRVLILDENATLGNFNDCLGLGLRYELHNVLDGDCGLDDVMREARPRLFVLPAARAARAEYGRAAAREKHAALLARATAHADVVLIDAAPGHAVRTWPIAGDARSLIVVPAGAQAVTAAYGLVKRVAAAAPGARASVAVTRARDGEEGAAIHANLAGVARRYLALPLDYAGSYAADAAAGETRAHGDLAAHMLGVPADAVPAARGARAAINNAAGNRP